MKTRLLLAAALICTLPLSGVLHAQGAKKDEKKAPAPKPASEVAFDEFQKVRNRPGAKNDGARFQEIINAGIKFITAHPATGRTNEVVNYLGVGYPMVIDSKQPELRMQYVSMVKLEATNQKYKDGITDPVKAAMLALDAAAAEFELRMAPRGDTIVALREKIDALGELPAGNRFLADRERALAHLLIMMNQTPRAEEQLKKLTTHKEKAVSDMAKSELNTIEVRKAPFDLKFTALDGKPVDLATLRGKVVALYFWSSTSKSSTDLLDKLRQFHSDYRKRGFELVTVSYDKEEDRAKLQKYIKDTRLSVPVHFDGKQAKNAFAPKLNTYSVPRLMLFDQQGILQAAPMSGNLSTNYSGSLGQFEADVKKMLKIK